jgi:tetratricopeptide (TPR) repeat protein
MRKSFFHTLRWIGLIFLIGVIFGCAAAPPKPSEPTPPIVPVVEKDPYSQFPEYYRRKAIEFEKQGELKKALHRWLIVASFIPDDGEVAKRVTELKAQIQKRADEHFGKGLSYYQKNSIPEARKEFLLTLYYHPDHKEALNYLKNKLAGEEHKLYEVKKGDTLKEIAQKNYNDPQKDFFIAYFNDLGKDPKLIPKTILKIPVLESSSPKPPLDKKELPMDEKGMAVDTKEMLNRVKVSYRAKEYHEVASLAQKILEYDPTDKEAKDLLNDSYYQLGKSLSRGKRYEEALAMFNRVEPGYKDVREATSVIKKQLADIHYIKGVKYFTEEELEKAIKEWDETLLLDPNHPKAKKDIENARSLLKKLKEFK